MELTYNINAAGEVVVTEKMTTDKEAKVADLFRYGMQLQMPAAYSKLEYYGRGPEENYIDRHASALSWNITDVDQKRTTSTVTLLLSSASMSRT